MQLHYDNQYVQRIQTDNIVCGYSLSLFFSVFLNFLIEGIV